MGNEACCLGRGEKDPIEYSMKNTNLYKTIQRNSYKPYQEEQNILTAEDDDFTNDYELDKT